MVRPACLAVLRSVLVVGVLVVAVLIAVVSPSLPAGEGPAPPDSPSAADPAGDSPAPHSHVSDRAPPVLGPDGLLVEAEELSGSWKLQTNVPGYSGWGFRVSNAAGVAADSLRLAARTARPARVSVWARGLASANQDRSFSVQVGGVRFPPVCRPAAGSSFRWERCGTVDLAAGEVAIVIRDEGAGYECPDALFLAPDPEAEPPGLAGDPPLEDDQADRGGVSGANLERLRALEAEDDGRRKLAATGRAAWEARRPRLQRDVRRVLGLDAFPERGPLQERGVGTLERDGYRIEKIVFESRPGMPVPANLYLPDGACAPEPPWPAVLCPVGHWGRSKAEPVVQARAAGLARLGFAALVYDALGQGERAIAGNEHSHAAIAALLGESNMTYMVWDSVRALDLLARRADVDPSRLGATGCSGGGLNTLYLIAVDERVAAAASVGYVSTFASFLGTGILHCPCSHVPGMARLTDMGEIAALFAPKPLLVVGGRRDPMFTEAGMREAFGEIERLHALSVDDRPGEAGRLRARVDPPSLFFDDCGHDYSRPMRERAYGFFLKALGHRGSGDAVPEPLEEGVWKPERPEDLWCFAEGRVPAGSLTYRRSVEEGLAARRGLPRGEVLDRLADVVPRTDPASWRSSPLRPREASAREAGGRAPRGEAGGRDAAGDGGDAAGDGALRGELVLGDEGFVHRVLARARRDPASPLTAIVLEDAGLTPFTPGFLGDLLALGFREARAVEPPLWSETGDRAHLAWTNGLLVGRPVAALWVRCLLGEIERSPGGVSIVARGPAASSAALVAALLGGEKVRALAAVGAPGTWLELVSGGVGKPGGILPRAGLAGDLPDLLAAGADLPVLWSGARMDGDLPDFPAPVDVRPSPARPPELAAWLARSLSARP